MTSSDIAPEFAGGGLCVDRGKVAQRDTLGDIDGEFTAVDQGNQLGQLVDLGFDEHSGGPHPARVVAGSGHPCGRGHDDAAVTNAGDERRELVRTDRRQVARLSEELGYDLVTFQDHPHQSAFHNTWTLLSYVAAATTTIQLAPNVLNLPLRPAPVIARSAASLDLLSGGRFNLGLGAGGSGTPSRRWVDGASPPDKPSTRCRKGSTSFAASGTPMTARPCAVASITACAVRSADLHPRTRFRSGWARTSPACSH